MDSQDLILGFAWYLVFVFSTVLHEAAHAVVAWKLGDPTAYQGGQATIDPIPHIRREPFGMVVVPLLSFVLSKWMIGWASAPYDPVWAYRYPKRSAVMALAGPATNLTLAVLAGLAIKAGLGAELFERPGTGPTFSQVVVGDGALGGVARILSIAFVLNLLLCVFNLLPVPPLDGSAVVPLFLPAQAARKYMDLARQPMFAIFGIVIAWQLIDRLFRPVLVYALGLVYGAGR
jgi:Zn-dependent protease